MSNVNFYILQKTSYSDRHQFACRLCEKAWLKGHRVHIRCKNKNECEELNSVLWNFREYSFLPHIQFTEDQSKQAGEGIAPDDICREKVTLDWRINPYPSHGDMLINLTDAYPECVNDFTIIAEIVIQIPEVLQTTRENFASYKKRNLKIKTYKT